MNKFLVLYRAPISVLEEWAAVDAETRKVTEEKMRNEWQAWATTNATHIKETAGAGKTKHVTSEGATDTNNDIMLYSIVEAASHEAAAALFAGHPHLQIPGASIDVMPATALNGM